MELGAGAGARWALAAIVTAILLPLPLPLAQGTNNHTRTCGPYLDTPGCKYKYALVTYSYYSVRGNTLLEICAPNIRISEE